MKPQNPELYGFFLNSSPKSGPKFSIRKLKFSDIVILIRETLNKARFYGEPAQLCDAGLSKTRDSSRLPQLKKYLDLFHQYFLGFAVACLDERFSSGLKMGVFTSELPASGRVGVLAAMPE